MIYISDEELANKLKTHEGSKRELLRELNCTDKELKQKAKKLKSVGLLSEVWYAILISRFFINLFKRRRNR